MILCEKCKYLDNPVDCFVCIAPDKTTVKYDWLGKYFKYKKKTAPRMQIVLGKEESK